MPTSRTPIRILAAAAAAVWAAGPALAAGPAPTDHGAAPEFKGISAWLNSPKLTMAGLRGKVVLVDFWAYSCINCLRTLPFLIRWQHDYKERGLVVVGVQTPEFKFEHDPRNVQAAIDRFHINYPVAIDNDTLTWTAFNNQFWPEEYLIDRQGRIVYTHSGEGDYDATENAIRALLKAGPAVGPENGPDLDRIGSPEMYFGLDRVDALASPEGPHEGTHVYTDPHPLKLNTFALVGSWTLSGEHAALARDGGGVVLHCRSGKVFMVASSPQPETISVSVDGKPAGTVQVHESRLYTLFDSADYRDHTVTLSIPKAGFEAFTFTFG